jgi:copper chaperone CopZ
MVDSAMRFEVLIDGMLAVHAKHAVFTALSGVEGITLAEVELGRAEVAHDGRATESAIRSAIEAAGFSVRSVRAMPRTLPML